MKPKIEIVCKPFTNFQIKNKYSCCYSFNNSRIEGVIDFDNTYVLNDDVVYRVFSNDTFVKIFDSVTDETMYFFGYLFGL